MKSVRDLADSGPVLAYQRPRPLSERIKERDDFI
jgi:hypothetical protein